MAIGYDPLLVLLSVVVAIQASYVGLRLTIQVPDSHGMTRRLLLVGASLSLGMGIWGMHFVGMLAARLPVGVEYQILPTLISFLVCVLVVGFAIVAASLWPKTPATLAVTASVMGVGIATMHYVGMMALHDSLHMMHDPSFVALSVGAAVAASAAALWLATMARRRPPLIVCAVVLGLAISSMHYIAMAGTMVHAVAMGGADSASPSLSTGLMAIVVAVVAFIISSGFLLTLVPDAGADATAAPAPAADLPAHPQPATEPFLGEASVETLSVVAEPLVAVERPAPRPLPAERDGGRIMIPPAEIYAVRANAHYCYVFNGEEDLFCSLSISDAEEHLAGGPFARVHRSHIVNLDHIAGVRKTADGGFADLDGARRVSVPVSRAKINELRDRFAGHGFPSRGQQRAS